MRYKANLGSMVIVFIMCVIAITSGWVVGCFFFYKELLKDFNIFNVCCLTINLFLAMPFLKNMLDYMAEQEEWLEFQRQVSIYGQACLQTEQKSPEGIIIAMGELIKRNEEQKQYKGCQKD